MPTGLGRNLARAEASTHRRALQHQLRHLEDGDVFDAYRLVRNGPEVWRPSYLARRGRWSERRRLRWSTISGCERRSEIG
jgi:hypothetical protein